jgi:hypothetical protein
MSVTEFTGLDNLYFMLSRQVGSGGTRQLSGYFDDFLRHGQISSLATIPVGSTGRGDVIIGLILAVLGALIAAGVLAALRPLASRREWSLPRVDSGYFSISNLVWLTGWFGLYAVRITREFVGDSVGIPSRTTLGTLIVIHYLIGVIDRSRRGLDLFSRTAPLAAALTAVTLTASRGTIWGAIGAFVAATLFLIGYFKAEAYGRRTFGIAMFAFALGGGLSVSLGKVSLGEFLLVMAGIIAGARSITAFLKGVEDRGAQGRSTTPLTPVV